MTATTMYYQNITCYASFHRVCTWFEYISFSLVDHHLLFRDYSAASETIGEA